MTTQTDLRYGILFRGKLTAGWSTDVDEIAREWLNLISQFGGDSPYFAPRVHNGEHMSVGTYDQIRPLLDALNRAKGMNNPTRSAGS